MSPRCAFPGCGLELDGFPHGVCAPLCRCGSGAAIASVGDRRKAAWCHDFVYPDTSPVEGRVTQASLETRAAVAALTSNWPVGGGLVDTSRLPPIEALTTYRPPQHQGSLNDQLKELIELANRNGLYDAADYLVDVLGGAE